MSPRAWGLHPLDSRVILHSATFVIPACGSHELRFEMAMPERWDAIQIKKGPGSGPVMGSICVGTEADGRVVARIALSNHSTFARALKLQVLGWNADASPTRR